MEWIKAIINTASGADEVLTGLLSDCGVEGVEVRDEYENAEFLKNNKTQWDYADASLLNKSKGSAEFIFYVALSARSNETISAVRDALDALRRRSGGEYGVLSLDIETVDDKDWLEEWKKYYKPFKIGKNIVVKPVWEDYAAADGELVYTINPGSIFGTGLHQSTQLCVEELEKYVKANDLILDIGCGSGILFVVALMLGAEKAVATDIEPAAAYQAEDNATLNGFLKKKHFTVYIANLLDDEQIHETIEERVYDIVTANIVSEAVIKLCAPVSKMIRQGGVFITSGIIRDKAEQTRKAIEGSGFEIIGENVKDEWVCFTALKI
jgi:ribosomal protein L11 methyltransferase